MRRRTRARELAIQFLYQADLRGDLPGAGVRAPDDDPAAFRTALDEFLAQAAEDGLGADDDARQFARRLVVGTQQHLAEIDTLLRQVARNWDLRRMAVVDRNVLRMAVYEMLHCADIPPKVTINEAIEIGKKFSTANSGAFINGLLDRIRLDRVGARESAQPAPPAEHAENA